MRREPLPLALVRAGLALLHGTLARPYHAVCDWVAAVRPARRAEASNTVLLAVPAAVLAAGAAVVFLVGTRTTGSLGPGAAVHTVVRRPTVRWLAYAGRFRVERVRVPQTGLAVDLRRPPAGVGHTTECSFECALRVFRRRNAPTFLVGRDRVGRVRIVQLVPLGEAAGSLVNLPGGVETNRWARAQIELVARSHASRWTADPEVMTAFASLLVALRDDAGIPLSRPFADGYSRRADAVRRASGEWGRVAGWFNHGEIPENDHWDMGAFRWTFALADARRESRLVTAARPAGRPLRG